MSLRWTRNKLLAHAGGVKGLVRMEDQALIKHIRADVKAVLEKGQVVIGAKALDEYLEQFESVVKATPDEKERAHRIQLESFKQENDRNIAKFRADTDINIEMLRTVLNTALAALKTSLLVNGASAVALLGFLSRVWSADIPSKVAQQLSEALFIFGIGVLCSAMASIGAYFSQVYFNEGQPLSATIARVITISLVIISFILFGFGLWHSFIAFSQNL